LAKPLVVWKLFCTFADVKQKEIKNMKIKNITWETDGEEVDLPTEVDLPNGIEPDDDDAINDYLSDTYGWLVIDWYVE
jgi:hypothetical protein